MRILTPCPCCGTPVAVPTIEMLMTNCDIRPNTKEEAILRAVWRGKGHAVPTSAILDAVWADDPSGGPILTEMYVRLKHSMHGLRKKLDGSGVSIESAGYGRGYKLTIHKEKT